MADQTRGKLNYAQKKFVILYTRSGDEIAAAAEVYPDSNPKTTAYRMLRNPKVIMAIDQIMRGALGYKDASKDFIVGHLVKIVTAKESTKDRLLALAMLAKITGLDKGVGLPEDVGAAKREKGVKLNYALPERRGGRPDIIDVVPTKEPDLNNNDSQLGSKDDNISQLETGPEIDIDPELGW